MTAQTELTEKVFNELFGSTATQFDLASGTIISKDDSRQVLITTDTLFGIYRSLSHETGEAWKVVLKNCGYRWGKRVMTQISALLAGDTDRQMSDVTVKEFCELIESYFQYHGWGLARIHLDDASEGGIVRVSVENSIMVQALADVSGSVDYLLAGMLRGLFEEISSAELDCHQVACQRTSSTGACEFLVSGMARVAKLEGEAQPNTVDDAISYLRAA